RLRASVRRRESPPSAGCSPAGSRRVAEPAPVRSAEVIVVGAGGSGAPLAARLSQTEARRVLVLEARPAPRFPDDFPPELRDARRVPGAAEGTEASWWFAGHLAAARPYRISRGRYLGGSTTTNGGYFQRPRRADLDRWSRQGGPAWSYEAMLPFMRSMETDL